MYILTLISFHKTLTALSFTVTDSVSSFSPEANEAFAKPFLTLHIVQFWSQIISPGLSSQVSSNCLLPICIQVFFSGNGLQSGTFYIFFTEQKLNESLWGILSNSIRVIWNPKLPTGATKMKILHTTHSTVVQRPSLELKTITSNCWLLDHWAHS